MNSQTEMRFLAPAPVCVMIAPRHQNASQTQNLLAYSQTHPYYSRIKQHIVTGLSGFHPDFVQILTENCQEMQSNTCFLFSVSPPGSLQKKKAQRDDIIKGASNLKVYMTIYKIYMASFVSLQLQPRHSQR